MKRILTLLYIFLILVCRLSGAERGLHFSTLPALDKLPTNYIRCVYQDKEGYIWLGTPYGLFMYDGYTAVPVRMDDAEFSLPNNEVLCIAEDNDCRLWVGTRQGLAMIEKSTWTFSSVNHPYFKDTAIQKFLMTSRGDLWIGTEYSLYYYDCQKDDYRKFDGKEGRALFPGGSVITMHEDRKGNVWVGTWADGLSCYDVTKNSFRYFRELGEKLNVSSVHFDRHNRMWIGRWGKGVILVEEPYEEEPLKPRYLHHEDSDDESLSDDFVYVIAENRYSGDLWFGTRSGLSILQADENRIAFDNYLPGESEKDLSYSEVYDILCDHEGNMWLGTYGGGVCFSSVRRNLFQWNQLKSADGNLNLSHIVQGIFVDNDDLLWLGSGSEGVTVWNRKTGRHYVDRDLDKLLEQEIEVQSFMQSPTTGKLWIGTYAEGVWIYDRNAAPGNRLTIWDWHSHSWIGSVVNDILEDSQGNCWFASNTGLSVLDTKGEKHSFVSRYLNGKPGNTYRFCHLMEDDRKRIWVASDNNGIVRVNGNATDSVPDLSFYSLQNGKLGTSVVSWVHQDKNRRVWAASEVGGLFLYEEEKDAFITVDEQLGLPGEAVFSMEEDKEGNLWLGTNVGLVKLSVPEDISRSTYYLYTAADGLQGNIFNRNVSFSTPEGEMFFGGNNGYNSFFPNRMKKDSISFPIIVTDIKVFDRSWRTLDKETRDKVSPLAPGFARKVTLNHQQNNFSIEFATLKFACLDYVQYAYRLEGMDSDWVHTDGTRPFAYYNNLESGKYTFHLKANTGNGGWVEMPHTIEICILPPPWLTWWAYTLYILVAIFVAALMFRTVRNRMLLRNEIRMRKLENAKLEELNHAKLQFFTNITHELLTPLAIISAAVDNRKQGNQKPEYDIIIGDNVNRLIRLIQQILEFRKAETGHLKLKVSRGNIALFVRNSVDSIRPFAEKKQIELSFESTDEVLSAYFDPDKLDKIIYNLLSNAIKYNRVGGRVQVRLERLPEKEQVSLTVTDNGLGMTRKQQEKLFSFFYEGDYRRFNTTGTGIGLALTKNLVNLHHGTIRVQSEVGKGTSFEIILPVGEQAFAPEEVDHEFVIPSAPLPVERSMPVVEKEAEPQREEKERNYSVLLVEDEVELLYLMKSLLEADYKIFTAENGRQGLEVLKGNSIDLIISDVMMPEMDGVEFCKIIKGEMETCDIPVILLTAKNGQADRVEAYDSGANAFISKPFNLSVLHARICNLLKAREQMNRDFKKQFVFEAKELEYTSMDEEFLQRAFACIHEHLDDPDYNQSDFVRDLAVSRSTAFRKLKSLTGLSYTDFVKNVRLKAACRIMEEKKNMRISELAYAVGFSDPKYFSTCFKKEFGMNPSEYPGK